MAKTLDILVILALYSLSFESCCASHGFAAVVVSDLCCLCWSGPLFLSEDWSTWPLSSFLSDNNSGDLGFEPGEQSCITTMLSVFYEDISSWLHLVGVFD